MANVVVHTFETRKRRPMVDDCHIGKSETPLRSFCFHAVGVDDIWQLGLQIVHQSDFCGWEGSRLALVARRRRRPYESPRPAYATQFCIVPSASSSRQALRGTTGETFQMVRRRSNTPKVGPDAKDARRARTAPGGIGGYRSCGTVPPAAVRVA